MRPPILASIPKTTLATALAATWLALPSLALADVSDWSDDERGATAQFSNLAAAIRWENERGDWSDAAGTPQGDTPFASFVIPRNANRFEVDVTSLVRAWAEGTSRADGFYLHSGRGTATLHSREAEDETVRPSLELDLGDGTVTLRAEADTALSPSTTTALGGRPSYPLGTILIRFPRAEIVGKNVSAARLVLHRVAPTGGDTELRVFACRQPRAVYAVEHGLAREYERDRGIEAHTDVLTAIDFSGDSWTADHPLWRTRNGNVVDQSSSEDVANGFEPLDGPAVRWGFAEGTNGGGGATLSFFSLPDDERPEELYSRYYVRFGRNFTPTVDGGKMPGFAYRPGGSPSCNGGSRDATGTVCWSARGSFSLLAPTGNTLQGYFGLGYYVYHSQQPTQYGSLWRWNQGYDAMVTHGRWYAVEEYVRVNTPGVANGVLRAWVNGRPVFQKNDLLFRHDESLKVGQVWYDIYHGGTAKAPHDMYFWVDNLVVAKSYIGPLGGVDDVPPLLEGGTLVEPPESGTPDGGAFGEGPGGGPSAPTSPTSPDDGPSFDQGSASGCRASAATPWTGILLAAWLMLRQRRSAVRTSSLGRRVSGE